MSVTCIVKLKNIYQAPDQRSNVIPPALKRMCCAGDVWEEAGGQWSLRVGDREGQILLSSLYFLQ